MRGINSYHRILRSSAVLCAVVLVFQSGVLSLGTQVLALHAERYVASTVVSMSASVPENEFNVVTAGLALRQKSLDERERALNNRALEVSGAASETTTLLLAATLLVLLVLIVLNYVLDFLRSRKKDTVPTLIRVP